jgi:hypothetical protein
MEGEETGEGEEVPQAMFPSAGACDEYIPIFLHEKRVPRDQLKEWTGKLTGLRDEGEKVILNFHLHSPLTFLLVKCEKRKGIKH